MAYASWHPAFMPNSVEVPLKAKHTSPPPQLSSPKFPPPSPLHTHTEPPENLPKNCSTYFGSDATGNFLQQDDRATVCPIKDVEQPKPQNLSDTSVLSGFPADDSHKVNGIKENVKYEVKKLQSDTKVSQNKHKSTTSFTRTVSEEVTWTDEEIDFDWSLATGETNVSMPMVKSDRTNSFPQIQFKHPPEMGSLHSHIEETYDETEQTMKDASVENEDNTMDKFFSKSSVTAGQQKNDAHEPSPAYDWLETDRISHVIHSPANQSLEADFQVDENIPQCKSDLHSSNVNISMNKRINPVENSDPIEELKNYHHDRIQMEIFERSSGDVIGEPGKQIAKNIEETQVGKSSVTPKSAISSSVDNSSNTFPRNFSGAPNVSNVCSDDTELVARWREALSSDPACDNLLEDDDLLPDENEKIGQVAHQNEIDPAALFNSDDDGFLEDLDEIAVDTRNQGSAAQKSYLSSSPALPEINYHNKELSSASFSRSSVNNSQLIQENTKTSNSLLEGNLSSNSQLHNPSKYLGASIMPSNSSSYPAVKYAAMNSQGTDSLKTKSYASMSKGGYSSPYDLPMDLVPKKRSSAPPINRMTSSEPSSPPRLSSQSNNPTNISPNLNVRNASQPLPSDRTQPAKVLRNSKSSFFEELPISSKFVPAARHSTNLPSRNQDNQPSEKSIASAVTMSSQRNSPLSYTPHSQSNNVLVAPNRVSPYAPLSSINLAASQLSSNHNPIKTPQNHSQPSQFPASHAGIKQFAPTYGASQPTTTNLRSYHPRTSSPLAHFKNAQDTDFTIAPSSGFSADCQNRSAVCELNPRPFSPARETDKSGISSSIEEAAPQQSILGDTPLKSLHTIPLPPGISNNRDLSSNMNTSYTNTSQQYQNNISSKFSPPPRPRTQSPKSMLIDSRNKTVKNERNQRPASVESAFKTQSVNNFSSKNVSIESDQDVNYSLPNDGRELDPLQRWKGSPIFVWGVGGTIITSFPKNLPRCEMNQTFPSLVRYPGEIKVRSMKEINPLNPLLAQFPGPLKAKTKKKEVIAWLTSGIELLEIDATHLSSKHILSHEDKCLTERILLWKILRTFVEHDGILEGTPNVEKAVRVFLSPEENTEDTPLYATSAQLLGASQTRAPVIQSDAADPATIYKIKEFLMHGQREKAVWESVDKRLWAHAILISNTVSRELYKQVAQEFIQKELRIIGDKTQPLAALYEIFAGNFEESIDELVPPSARAGFQLVSTSDDSESSSDALSGLDKWRETLTLILSNRNVEDTRALTALGKLLTSYGRTEAAHICFLFARSQVVFGGIDDTLTLFSLVGSDHLKHVHGSGVELESIILSEVFEYGISLSNNTTTAVPIPHLAAYKLHFAKILAEFGFCDKAVRYCDAIAIASTSQTRRSLYYHSRLIFEVEDLSQRLKQSPKDESSSWISRPSIDKARGSVWATFNKFVAGDESDCGDNPSNLRTTPDFGPFSKIAGETPKICYPTSITEFPGLSNNYPGPNNTINPISTSSSSRYAPISAHAITSQDSGSASPHVSQTPPSVTSRSLADSNRYEPERPVSSIANVYQSRPQLNQESSINISQTSSNAHSQLPCVPDPTSLSANQIPLYFQPLDAEYSSSDPPSSLSSNILGNTDSNLITSQQSYQPVSIGVEASSDVHESPMLNSYEHLKGGYERLISPNDDSNSTSGNVILEKKSKGYEANNSSNREIYNPKDKTSTEKDRETDDAFPRAKEAAGKQVP